MLVTQTDTAVVKNIVFNSIQQVMEDNEIKPQEVLAEMRLVKDLHFTSLMIAQLIMLIQEEIHREPFSEKYAISDMITVMDYINAYSQGE